MDNYRPSEDLSGAFYQKIMLFNGGSQKKHMMFVPKKNKVIYLGLRKEFRFPDTFVYII